LLDAPWALTGGHVMATFPVTPRASLAPFAADRKICLPVNRAAKWQILQERIQVVKSMSKERNRTNQYPQMSSKK
jgi:hypothetical protein